VWFFIWWGVEFLHLAMKRSMQKGAAGVGVACPNLCSGTGGNPFEEGAWDGGVRWSWRWSPGKVLSCF